MFRRVGKKEGLSSEKGVGSYGSGGSTQPPNNIKDQKKEKNKKTRVQDFLSATKKVIIVPIRPDHYDYYYCFSSVEIF